MKIKAAAVLLLAMATTPSLAGAAEGNKGFTYRYTKTIFVDPGGPTNPTDPGGGDGGDGGEGPVDPPPACGTFEIDGGFTASSQTLDVNGDCVFAAPKANSRALGFDYKTAAAFCASTMNGGGRIADISKSPTLETRGIRGSGSALVASSYRMPGIANITCSIATSPCSNSEFQQGGTCLPKTDLSCGRLKNDSLHYLPAGPEVEMANIGSCTFQIPMVTISDGGVPIMGEGQTMKKWVGTLKPSGYPEFDPYASTTGYISAYSLSASSDVNNAQWLSNSNIPTIPRISRASVDYITISSVGYGSVASLPADLNATPIPPTGGPMDATTTVTLRFTPDQSGDGDSQIAGIELFDGNGYPIDLTSVKLNTEMGPEATTLLDDGAYSTSVTFRNEGQGGVSTPYAVTLTWATPSRIGAVAFQAAGTNVKFPRMFSVYAKATAGDPPIFTAGTRQYVESQKVPATEWTRIANPYNN
ncbi:hypothetical protein O9X98_11100 [Agrobacterium salinitolerans]|nr:hypothetical protein [Agrobacterium salinitolerans]